MKQGGPEGIMEHRLGEVHVDRGGGGRVAAARPQPQDPGQSRTGPHSRGVHTLRRSRCWPSPPRAREVPGRSSCACSSRKLPQAWKRGSLHALNTLSHGLLPAICDDITTRH